MRAHNSGGSGGPESPRDAPAATVGFVDDPGEPRRVQVRVVSGLPREPDSPAGGVGDAGESGGGAATGGSGSAHGQPRGIMGQKSGRKRRVLATSSLDSLQRVPDRELMDQQGAGPPAGAADPAPMPPPVQRGAVNGHVASPAQPPQPGAVSAVHSVSGRTATEVLTAWAISQESH